MGTIWKQSGSQQQVGISRPPLGRVRPIPTTCLPGLGLGLLHDDRSGLNALLVQPEPSPGEAMMRQAARRDMQPAVSVSCLNAAACIGMDDERVTARVRVRVIAQAVAARVLSPLLQIRSRGEYLRGPTDEGLEEDQDETGIIRPSSGSSIASLLSLMGPSGGRPLAGWGRQWMNAKLPRSHRPESEFTSRKYPISLLLHRIESVTRDVAWRPLFLPFLGTTTHQHTVMYIPNQANPHAFAALLWCVPSVLFRCGVACVCVHGSL